MAEAPTIMWSGISGRSTNTGSTRLEHLSRENQGTTYSPGRLNQGLSRPATSAKRRISINVWMITRKRHVPNETGQHIYIPI